MTPSPFRCVLLPTLLVASAGLTAWTTNINLRANLPSIPVQPWMTSTLGLTQTVPSPAAGWVALSSVAISVGTLKARRALRANTVRHRRVASPQLAPVSAIPAQVPVVVPLSRYPLSRVTGNDQQQHLALQVAGQSYLFYRRRPTLAKALGLVKHLQTQGQVAIATHDEADYAVWVHRP
jgi:hypothetical protein